MNLLKSLFISGYMMMTMGITGYAGWRLAQGADWAAWGGVLMTSGPLLMIGCWMMFSNVARSPANLPLFSGLAIVGVLLVIWSERTLVGLAPMLALLGLAGTLIYIYWYSKLNRGEGAKVRLGDPLPDFTVTDVNGSPVTSQQLSDRPAILIFYRGNWCPLCIAQVKEMVAIYDDIRNMGVRVAFISPQPHDKTIALAKRFDVSFDFLSDQENQAARLLGIDSSHGLPMGMQALGYESETVLPTVIITDAKGRVAWVHETDNYRVRPDPDVYMEVLRQQGIVAAEE